METAIQILEPNNVKELNKLITVFEIVFETESFKRPSQTHLKRLLNKEDFFALTAKADNSIVAGLI